MHIHKKTSDVSPATMRYSSVPSLVVMQVLHRLLDKAQSPQPKAKDLNASSLNPGQLRSTSPQDMHRSRKFQERRST